MIKWKLVSWVLLLACMILQAAPVMAQGTEVSGTIPLVNSNISASIITETSATISWQTNGNATSQVFYDTASHDNATDYAHQTSASLSLVPAHSVSLTGLASGTSYHYRAKSELPATAFIDVSADYTFTTLGTPAGGGGGGGGGFGSQLVGIGLSVTSLFMDGNGRALTAGQVRTPDGSLSLSIQVGTYVWNAAGAAQSFVSASPLAGPPQAPPQHSLVLAFEMGPNGVTFNPAISLTITYRDDQIPAGTRESDLYSAWWDGAKWVKIESTVDTAANTVTAQVSHFTSFALLSQQPPPTTTPPPTTAPAGKTWLRINPFIIVTTLFASIGLIVTVRRCCG